MRQCPESSKFISVIETIAKIINSHILINSGYDCKFCGGFTRERKSESVVIWTRIITIISITGCIPYAGEVIVRVLTFCSVSY